MSDTDTTEDLKKKRVLQLAEDTADLFKDLIDRLVEMSIELDVSAADILTLVQEHVPETEVERRIMLWLVWKTLFPVAALKAGDEPMQQLLGRLFAEAPKLTDGKGHEVPGQAPALPFCQVTLKSGAQLQGVLSTTPEGLYKVGIPGTMPAGRGEKAVLVENFFDLSDVALLSVPRDLETKVASGIVHSSH